jgi:hypothetical protein
MSEDLGIIRYGAMSYSPMRAVLTISIVPVILYEDMRYNLQRGRQLNPPLCATCFVQDM